MSNVDRKLVTIRTISSINPIEGADAIEVLSIDGWNVVAKKGEFRVGDKCVYFEVDAFLPEDDERFNFLMKSTRVFNGVKGHVLRTIKLRGQVSQGLALPLSLFPEIDNNNPEVTIPGVIKYEKLIPASIAGQVKSYFPSFIQRTDQERIQNILDQVYNEHLNTEFEVTLKLDGTSVTYYHLDGEMGACSRNLELKLNDENSENTIVKMFLESNLMKTLPLLGNIAIQGELMGPGIQGNREDLTHHTFFIFDVQKTDGMFSKFMSREERMRVVKRLADLGVDATKVKHIDVINPSIKLNSATSKQQLLESLLDTADGSSMNNPVREGIVFKATDGSFSFKVINNKFLLKDKNA